MTEMMTMIKEMLTRNDSCAVRTLAKAMVEWYMASDEEDAINQIIANPGEDLAGISNSVIAGLTCCADQLGIPAEMLIEERDLSPLGTLTADQVVLALDAIHLQWISDNLTARRWAEKFFKGQLDQYRKTSKISFSEVSKDLLFIQQYLTAGGSELCLRDIEQAFTSYSLADEGDEDLDRIVRSANSFKDEIISAMEAFEKKAKPEMAKEVRLFLEEYTDPKVIITETLCCL